MKTFLLIILPFFLINPLCAQQKVFLKPERNSNGSIDFYCTNDSFSTRTIQIEFSSITNSIASSGKYTIKPGKSRIFTLRPIVEKEGIRYHYKSRSREGQIVKKLNTDFKYLLPIKPGNISKTYVYKKNINEEESENSSIIETISYSFLVNEGDSAYAARKGVVVEVEDNNLDEEVDNYKSTGKSNKIRIEHKDGTFASYMGFQHNQILVKEGDIILPGQLLGKIIRNNSEQEGRAQLSFRVYYLRDFDFFNPKEHTSSHGRKTVYAYNSIAPVFHTSEGPIRLEHRKSYTAPIITPDIITTEFSKRERKKWLAGKL